jgi:hypothetical protein
MSQKVSCVLLFLMAKYCCPLEPALAKGRGDAMEKEPIDELAARNSEFHLP